MLNFYFYFYIICSDVNEYLLYEQILIQYFAYNLWLYLHNVKTIVNYNLFINSLKSYINMVITKWTVI